jgi:phosphatidylglycerophosphate synthase
MLDWMGPIKPLAPALVVSAYFLTMFALFNLRIWTRGLPVDADVVRRSDSKLLTRYWRHYLMWVLKPYENALVRLGVSPNTITFVSLLTAAGSGWAFANGRFSLGGWLYLLTGILDIFDGRVARASGKVSAGGAFFDSVMDRYAEMLVFGGMAYFYRDSWAMLVAMAAGLGSMMVSYTRARAEGLGVNDVNIGTMQRPERLLYLGVISAVAPIAEAFLGHGTWPAFMPVVIALGLLAVSANVTAVRRILHTLERLEERAREMSGAPETTIGLKKPVPVNQPVVAPVLPLRVAGGRN